MSPIIQAEDASQAKEKILQEKKPTIIIQTGNYRTGSTVLVNLLCGFIIPDTNVNFLSTYLDPFTTYSIFKAHEINLDILIDKYSDKYDLYFVLSERGGRITP